MTSRSRIRAICACAVVFVAGCSATVTPPIPPAHPTTVYLCDYGYHSSLLLPVGSDGTFVEYLFGDWDWAALDHTGVGQALRAGLISSGATLGRRYVYDPPSVLTPHPMTRPVTQTAVTVDADRCQRLQQALDARWCSHANLITYTGWTGAYYLYVRDDEPYGCVHNCNRETANWLEQLGCQVHGWPLLSHFTCPERNGTAAQSKGPANSG